MQRRFDILGLTKALKPIRYSFSAISIVEARRKAMALLSIYWDMVSDYSLFTDDGVTVEVFKVCGYGNAVSHTVDAIA